MFGFVERATGHPDESTIILKSSSIRALGEVGADPIRGPYHLLANGVFLEVIPA